MTESAKLGKNGATQQTITCDLDNDDESTFPERSLEADCQSHPYKHDKHPWINKSMTDTGKSGSSNTPPVQPSNLPYGGVWKKVHPLFLL